MSNSFYATEDIYIDTAVNAVEVYNTIPGVYSGVLIGYTPLEFSTAGNDTSYLLMNMPDIPSNIDNAVKLPSNAIITSVLATTTSEITQTALDLIEARVSNEDLSISRNITSLNGINDSTFPYSFYTGQPDVLTNNSYKGDYYLSIYASGGLDPVITTGSLKLWYYYKLLS
jgi:hypothetical protein